jgi:uncharacterized membrane protein YbhN (UPF0104 family)
MIVLYLYKKGSFSILQNCSLFDLCVLILLTFLGYFIGGYQLNYLLKVQNKVSLSSSDITLLPLSMSLFAYIIPTNGGLLYSVFFLKKKYAIDSSQGFSIGVFTVYTSFIITGIIGLIVCIILNTIISILTGFSILLIFSPFIIILLNRYFQKINFKQDSWFQKVQIYINRIIVSSKDLIRNRKALLINITINLAFIIVLFLLYSWLNRILQINISLSSLVLLILLLRISSLVRVLPGNLGVEELLTAGIFSLIGKDPAVGLMFSLFLRLSAFVLVIPLGIFHTVFNLKYFSLTEFRSLLNLANQKVKKNEDERE